MVKFILLLFGLTYISNNCNAIEVIGYVINQNQDTIYGTIKLHKFSQITGAFMLNGFDMESLHYKVSFKSNADKLYQTFSTDMILGFGFSYKATDYVYKRFLLKSKSIFRKARQKFRFLNLIYKGNVSLYQNIINTNTPSINAFNNTNITYYEYFLFSNSKGLLKVAMNEQIRTMRDLLQQFDIDEQYIKEIPENTKFKDIKIIVENYDKWLLVHYPKKE